MLLLNSMQEIEVYRYIGMVAIVCSWVAIATAFYKKPVSVSKSISKHVSVRRKTWLMFAPIQTVSLALLYLFMTRWLIPVLDLPRQFNIIVIVGIMLELITTWIPDTSGLNHKIHHYTAYSAAMFIPIVTTSIPTNDATPTVVKYISYTCSVIAIYIIGMFLLSGHKAKQKHLIYQCTYFLCLHISLMAVIFAAK